MNDKFYLTYLGALTITLPPGLYNLTAVAQEISLQLVNAGKPADLFDFVGNTATQTVTITCRYVGTSIDFTQAATIRTLLGFASAVLGPTLAADYSFTGTSQAAFNITDQILLHTDLINNGI